MEVRRKSAPLPDSRMAAMAELPLHEQVHPIVFDFRRHIGYSKDDNRYVYGERSADRGLLIGCEETRCLILKNAARGTLRSQLDH